MFIIIVDLDPFFKARIESIYVKNLIKKFSHLELKWFFITTAKDNAFKKALNANLYSELTSKHLNELIHDSNIKNTNIMFLTDGQQNKHLLSYIHYTYVLANADNKILKQSRFFAPSIEQDALNVTIIDFLYRHKIIIEL